MPATPEPASQMAADPQPVFPEPAFPVPFDNLHHGMSQRTYIAAQVAAALSVRLRTHGEDPDVIADCAVMIADALVERLTA